MGSMIFQSKQERHSLVDRKPHVSGAEDTKSSVNHPMQESATLDRQVSELGNA